jgi:hypothetical protein
MNYQRILMLTDLGADPQPACEAIRRFTPFATHVTAIARQPPRLLAWVTPAAPADLNEAAGRALDDLRRATEGTAAAVEVALESELTAEALADAVATCDIDLVVVASLLLEALSMGAELRKRSSVPVLCVRSAPAPIGETILLTNMDEGSPRLRRNRIARREPKQLRCDRLRRVWQRAGDGHRGIDVHRSHRSSAAGVLTSPVICKYTRRCPIAPRGSDQFSGRSACLAPTVCPCRS